MTAAERERLMALADYLDERSDAAYKKWRAVRDSCDEGKADAYENAARELRALVAEMDAGTMDKKPDWTDHALAMLDCLADDGALNNESHPQHALFMAAFDAIHAHEASEELRNG